MTRITTSYFAHFFRDKSKWLMYNVLSRERAWLVAERKKLKP